LWCYLFISHLELGVFGASLALNTTYISNFIIQELYVNVFRKSKFTTYSWPLFDVESISAWGEYLKLAVPTTLLMCIEWWAFEFIIIFSGILGV
jgi:MATE family multidrug resistance protein